MAPWYNCTMDCVYIYTVYLLYKCITGTQASRAFRGFRGSRAPHDGPGRTPQTPQDAPEKRPRRLKRPPRRAKSRFWWILDLKMQPSSHQNHILKRCYLKIAWKQTMINFPIDFNDFSRFVNPVREAAPSENSS